jgi:DNA-binding response OmpR family regulator
MKTSNAHTPSAPLRLLLATGDQTLGADLARALGQSGFRVDWVHWGGDLQRSLRELQYACLLLGTDLPDLPGEMALQTVRQLDTAPPLIVITGSLCTTERIRLLDAGADDHLTWPGDVGELAARVRAVARRTHRARTAAVDLVHGPLCLRVDRRSATWHGRDVPLTNMEFWLLEIFVRRKQHALSRANLEELIYGWGEQTGSNTVEVHVHHLRRKFDHRLIRTLRGVGYQIGPADDLTGPS